jgi:hypothetical protein
MFQPTSRRGCDHAHKWTAVQARAIRHNAGSNEQLTMTMNDTGERLSTPPAGVPFRRARRKVFGNTLVS